MLSETLPAIYQLLLPPEFLDLNPQENKATCSNCLKSRPGPDVQAPFYDARLKCCTYYPFLPNYLIGALLTDEGESEGAQRLRALIRERRFALPIGVCAPPGYQEKFNLTRSVAFGRDPELLCPFYIFKNGHCGIWRHRGHECATFFCVSDYGAKGESFWHEVRNLLHYTEMFISQEAMLLKGYSSAEIDTNLTFVRQSPEQANSRAWQMEALEWSSIWAHHHDDIESYYKATYEFVQKQAMTLRKQVSDEKFRTGETDTRILRNLIVGTKISKNHRAWQSAPADARRAEKC